MQRLILLLIWTLLSVAATSATPPPPPTTQPHHRFSHTRVHATPYYPPTLFANILSTLGFQELSTAAANANLSATTPTTIFALSDSSLLTCATCHLPLLLQEHSLLGLYPIQYLRSLAFGTKVETLAPNRCLTITSSTSAAIADEKVFINGVEITTPDLFNNGLVIIHGLRGFVSHLSPISCRVEQMTTLSYSHPTQPLPVPEFLIMRHMLKDAMMRLRGSGYSVVALAMRVMYRELSEFKALTVFALDDQSIFAGGIGHTYVADMGFHIVPNRLLMGSDLVGLPPRTVFLTMNGGKNLVVTTAGGGGLLAPMRINYIKIKSFDLVCNSRVVVHGLSMPFPHVDHLLVGNDYEHHIERFRSGFASEGGLFGMMMAPVAGVRSAEDVDRHGL